MPPLPPGFLAAPIAHRALHDRSLGRIENSRAAVRAAVAAGYAIEIDVQPSADGVPVVFHDDTLDRLTAAAGPLRARTAADLGRTRLTDSDETIPMLAEILALVAGQVPLLVEIKDQDGALGPAIGPLEAAVAEAVAAYDGPLAVMSFNPHAVAAFAALAPHTPRGLTTCAFAADDWPRVPAETRMRLAAIADYDRTGASFVSHAARDLDAPRIAALKRQGAAIACWTIRSREAETEARRIADTITFEGYLPHRLDAAARDAI